MNKIFRTFICFLKIPCIVYGTFKFDCAVCVFFMATPSKVCYISKMIPFSKRSA